MYLMEYSTWACNTAVHTNKVGSPAIGCAGGIHWPCWGIARAALVDYHCTFL